MQNSNDEAPETTPSTSSSSKPVTVDIIPAPPKHKKRKTHSYDDLLGQATTTMNEMARIAKETPVHNPASSPASNDDLDVFGKFVVTELRGIQSASNNCMVRQLKRKIQQIIMDAWDTIDQPTMPPSPASSHVSWITPPQPIQPSAQPVLGNVISEALIMAGADFTSDCGYYEEP